MDADMTDKTEAKLTNAAPACETRTDGFEREC